MSPKTDTLHALETLLIAGDHLRELPLLSERLEAVETELRTVRLLLQRGEILEADHVYTSDQASRFLGMTPGSVNKIKEFPHAGGRFRGVYLMAFRGDITFDEAEAYLTAKRESVLLLVKSAATSL